ncbi:MAG: N-acetyl sugar amidotransferase [Gammaproteobacteria bacterium]|nr:N-acetyl sugar amidotransferase [Gammaproteobacteria bacterium]
MRNEGVDICSNCVMDSTDKKIIFDKSGVCDHCNTFKADILPSWNYGQGKQAKIAETVSKIKRAAKGKEFDCIIGMSGGIDSSYLVYLAKEKMGLNPLVFHVDAGWNSQIAVNNIEKIVGGLSLELFTEVINWEEMKDLQLAFFRSGVPHIDAPQDHSFFAAMYKFAEKNKIKYILTGGNYSTECVRNPKEWMYYQSDSKQIKDIHNKHGTRPIDSYSLVNVLRYKVYLPYFKKIKLIRPLDFYPYDKEDATKLLETKFGYQRYAQKHFESRFTRFYESYWLYEKFGYDTRKVQLSSLILTGQMSRAEALKILSKKPYDENNIHHDMQYIANKLDISVSELNSYLKAENKTYKDYKNRENLYNLGAYVMKRIGLERGGKR